MSLQKWSENQNIASLALLIALLTGWPIANARHSTHGTDNRSLEADAAWFLGSERSINYCIQISNTFGIEPERIKISVAEAFNVWANYIERKLPLAEIEKRFLSRSFTTKAALVACDGTEDLRFMFGVVDAKVTEAMKRYEDPVAFAEKESFDLASGWARGFLWFTDPRILKMIDSHNQSKDIKLDWQYGHVLDAVIRHELGHVFGIEHMAGTIMDGEILRRLFAPILDPVSCPAPTSAMTNIDDVFELIPCFPCNAEMYLSQSWSGTVKPAIFERLTGRPAASDISARVVVTNRRILDGSVAFKVYQKKVVLEVEDSSDRFTYDLGQSADGDRSVRNARGIYTLPRVFSAVFEHQGVSHNFVFEPASEVLKHLKIDLGGRATTVKLEYNVGGNHAPLIIRDQGDGNPKMVLFQSSSSITDDACYVPERKIDTHWK